MNKRLLNVEVVPGNVCFGYGAGNPHGPQIDVYRDPDDPGEAAP